MGEREFRQFRRFLGLLLRLLLAAFKMDGVRISPSHQWGSSDFLLTYLSQSSTSTIKLALGIVVIADAQAQRS